MKSIVMFFLGTEAELIKVFPIMLECEKRGIEYKIVASGQNDIEHSQILKNIGKTVDFALDRDTHITTGVQLVTWWLKIFRNARGRVKKQFKDVDFKKSVMLVHGDTVSTVMGAFIGRMLGMEVAHVEAGLRSYHLFNPLPEEIDRIVTSHSAKVHFAPGDIPVRNLDNVKGKIINTRYNTLSDSLNFTTRIPLNNKKVSEILSCGKEYFVFVLHRQENLMNKKFVHTVVRRIERISEKYRCVIILHNITETTFKKENILDRLQKNSNIVLLPRVEYCDFMKLLKGSEFVISDGGSNQEELYYMGKPCLIMRKSTERDEGVGHNGIMFDGDFETIERFSKNYKKYVKDRPYIEVSPSEIIGEYLENESALSR